MKAYCFLSSFPEKYPFATPFFENNVSFTNKVNRKAMIRNKYNQIPHPTLKTNQERKTPTHS